MRAAESGCSCLSRRRRCAAPPVRR